MQETDEQLNERAFQAEDFEAYLPTKWTSNMYTLERRRVKNKLEIIGNILQDEIEDAALALTQHLSDEFPSLWNKKQVERQWLFFSRDEAARKELTNIIDREKTLADTLADPTPLYRHLFLGVSISETHLEIGIRIHFDAWVDRKNLLNLFADADRRREFEIALKKLPEHFEIGLDGHPLTTTTIEALEQEELETLITSFEAEHGWIFMGARLPKDQVLVIGPEIGESASAVFRALLPIYKLMAWAPSNDLISIDKVVAAHNEAIKQSREELDRERKEREDRLRQREVIGLAMREQIAEKVEATQAWRSREIAAKRAAFIRAQNESQEKDAKAKAEAMAASWGFGKKAEAKSDVPSKKPVTSSPKPRRPDRSAKDERFASKEPREKRPLSPSSYRPARTPAVSEGVSLADIGLGSYVEVTKGFLKGRRGTIQEIDEKGGIKVAFGALSSRLEKDEIRFLATTPPPEAHHRKGMTNRSKSSDRR